MDLLVVDIVQNLSYRLSVSDGGRCLRVRSFCSINRRFRLNGSIGGGFMVLEIVILDNALPAEWMIAAIMQLRLRRAVCVFTAAC